MLAATPPVQAMEVRSGDTVVVPAGTVIDDDLFITGQSVTIAGQVNGEVFAFGQTVIVTGSVQRDLIAAGQQVTLDGTVGGDLRAAGQQVTVNGRVDGNVTTGAQTVLLGRQGAIAGSLLGGMQDVNLLGPVGRSVMVGAGSLQLAGTVGRDVTAQVETLTVDPSARVAGRLDYTSPRQTTIPAGAVAGAVQYRETERQERQERQRERDNPFAGLFGFFGLVWLIGSIIVGVLLVHFLPGFAGGTAAQVRDHPLPSFGIGILALFVAPAALFFVAITLVGLPIAFLGGLAYLAGLYLGMLLLGLAIGGLLVGLVRRGGQPPVVDPKWLMVLGLVVLYVVTHVPFVGGLATFVALCLGVGALLRQIAALWRPPAPPAAAPLAPAAPMPLAPPA